MIEGYLQIWLLLVNTVNCSYSPDLTNGGGIISAKNMQHEFQTGED